MIKYLLRCFLLLLLIGISVIAYIIYYASQNLPDYSQLMDYKPPSVTRIYSSDGKLIEEYAKEHRMFIPISSIPQSLIDAFVAAEDKNFFYHPGIDVFSIVRAIIHGTNNLLQNRKIEGGSTITQQVVKNFLLTPERSIIRKVKEAILAYRISKILSKEQILELYLNQIFLGKGAYGVAIAAQNYFNKSVDELNIAESALIAGLPKSPSIFNPEVNYERAKTRRDYVIRRMLEDGYITEKTAHEVIASPITLRKRQKIQTFDANYYAQHVREEVIKILGSESFYNDGLTIVTALDTEMQIAAESTLRRGIRSYDQGQGYRGIIGNIDTTNWQDNLKNIPNPTGLLEYQLGVVLSITSSKATIGLKDSTTVNLELANIKWVQSRLNSVDSLLHIGNVIIVEKIDKHNCILRQIPEVNGGIVMINPSTGQVLAMQGGYEFSMSKFDRVYQAERQPGSLIKPFVYLAALESGILPNTIFEDEPIEIEQGPNLPLWTPKNYLNNYLGPITMRTGLEKSRNLVTIRVAQAIGLKKVTDIIRRFKINDNPKMFYSAVLGSIESTLEKMATAYATIANSGIMVKPHYIEFIKDNKGNVIYRRDQNICYGCVVSDNHLTDTTYPILYNDHNQIRIIDEATNYQIISMLTGVIERGTGRLVKQLNKPIACKTGTTNDSKDAWFICFTPRILVGSYIGYDNPKTLGDRASGATVALPIFVDFMKNYDTSPPLSFQSPNSVIFITINPVTGVPTAKSDNTISEVFKLRDIPHINLQRQNMFNSDSNTQDQKYDRSHEIY